MVLAVALLVLGAPKALFAGHVGFDWSTVEAGGTCYSCHTLDHAQGAGALGTSMINPSARGGIFNLIKAANGGVTPTDLGCVFCHNNPSNVKMKGILNHFLNGWASRHPVGYNWNTLADSDHEYVSSIDASSRIATELDCADCHDASSIATGGSYVNHPGTISINNPNMLKLVSQDGEYDALCRSCHRSDIAVDVAGKGKSIQLTAHADAGSGRPIVEADGTVLKTTATGNANAQCTRCHDTHYSSKVKMFNDGHEGDPPIVGDNCLAVCHYPGDNIGYADDTTNNSYERHGHGRQTSTYKYRAGAVDYASGSYKTVNMSCASCHTGLDTGTVDGSRVAHVDKAPTGANDAEKYVKRYNLGLAVQDGGVSAGGNPVLGICENCHGSYEQHLAEGGNVVQGCQDCHDEHAENSGPTSNVFMIPLSGKKTGTYAAASRPRTGAEPVVYDTTRRDPVTGTERSDGSIDLYRADAAGICDNAECHGASYIPGTQPGPLAAFFAGGGHSLAGPQTPGTDCESCHKHEGGSAGTGSWGADPSGCASCHDYPNTPHVSGAHVLSTVHDKHTGTELGYAGSKAYGCDICHFGSDHNSGSLAGGAVANGTEWAAKVDPNLNVRVQVRFETSWNPGVGSNPGATTADNTNYNDTTNACSNTYCHGATLGAQGAATTPAWSGTLACNACHADTTTTLTSRSHQQHFTTLTGLGAQCVNCHTAYDLGQTGTHLNGAVNFVGTLAYSGAAGDKLPATGLGGCGTNYCHNDGRNAFPLVLNYTWGTAINAGNSCTECHTATTAINTGSHVAHLTTTTGLGAACGDCHTAATVATHGDGTVDLTGKGSNYPLANRPVAVNSVGGCGTNACHNNGLNGTPLITAYTWGTAINATNSCTECHTATTAINTGSHVAHITTTTGLGAACGDCHAAASVATHGDGTVTLTGAASNYPQANRVVAVNSVGSCGTNACHNNGQLNTPRTATYTWGTAINGPNSCTECHGDTSATQLNQAHDAHLALGGTYVVCTDCHAAASVATHANGTVNLANKAGAYAGGDVVVAVNGGTFGTCAAGSCHNATAGTNIAWNATPTNCNQCHLMTAAAAGEDNWNGRNGVISAVVNSEYTAQGHGKSASPAINKACTDCHEISAALAPHNFTTNLAGTNPFRLKAGFTCSDFNAGCHQGTTQSEGLAYSAIQTHSSVSMGGGKYSWHMLPGCVNCHDPHGDSSNIKMMQNELYDKAAFNLFAQPPAAPTEQTNLVFTDRTTGVGSAGNSWADSDTPWNSLCQECHENTAMFAFEDGARAGVAPHSTTVPLNCSTCHKHDSGFKGGGCDGCHGGGGLYWPQNAGNNLSGYPNRNGRHLSHLNDIAVKRYGVASAALLSAGQQTEACGMCHNDPNGVGGSGHDTNAPIYAEVGNFAQFWGTYQTTDVAPTRSWTTPGYTSSTWTAGTSTCVGVDCHNNTTTPTSPSYEWYGTYTPAANTSCTMCHTVGTTAAGYVNPYTGNHDTSITTHVRHDDSFQYGINGATLGSCGTCHVNGTIVASTTSGHINGTADTSPSAVDAADPKVYLAPTVGFTDAVAPGPTCAPNGALGACHLEQWKPTPASTWARLWHEDGSKTDGTQCKGCHGTWTAAGASDWRAGVSPVHTSDWDGATANEIFNNHDYGAATPTLYNQCSQCHVYSETAGGYFKSGETNNLGWAQLPANDSTNHGDGRITMNATMNYSTSAFNCTVTCHTTGQGNTAHNLGDSGWPVSFLNGPSLSCTGCHSGITTHRKVVKGGADVGCEMCHPGGGGALATAHNKNGAAYVVLIPNSTGNTSVGINYTGNLETGIYLGGFATSLYGTITSEAEMCWRCHDQNNSGSLNDAVDVSEWGTNTNTNGGVRNYNFGTLNSRNWFGATWTSGTPGFTYKSSTILSTHTANINAGGPTTTNNHTANPDTVGQVRCSYCHDVHELMKASGDTAAGKPYLRGSWQGNPYKEDGAPQSGTAYANLNSWGAVPRASSNVNQSMGGYWIDQNSNSPASGWTNFGGLCDLCHGATKDGALTTGEIDVLNTFGGATGGSHTEWTSGYNGHRNSVKGATGPSDATAARNIYNARGGTTAGATTYNPLAHYEGTASRPENYGFRGPSGLNYAPQTADQACKFTAASDQWGMDETGGTTQVSYHAFPCSKCHNAHASRLPRLMITNCLDTRHNTWDDAYQVVAVGTINRGRRMSNWTSAQNCHRLRGDGDGTLTGDSVGFSGAGWNKVTPW